MSTSTELPKPDDPDLAFDQPQAEDMDESTSELADRYGPKSDGNGST